MRSLCRWTAMGICAALAALTILLVLPGLFGITPLMVRSGSMEPAYPRGSLIYVKAVDKEELAEGETVTFYLSDQRTLVTHRIVRVDREAELIYTRGDANDLEDGQATPFSRILGSPALCVPGLGDLAGYLASQEGRAGIVLAVALVCLLSWLERKWRVALALAGFLLSGAGIALSVKGYAKEVVSAAVLAEGEIKLTVCILDSGEADGELLTELLPGETVERKAAVILDGDSPEAYIRVSVDSGGALQEGIHFCDGWLEGDDGYYYYQEKISGGSVLPVYDRITIPEDRDGKAAGQSFTVELSAQGAPADSLEPWISGEIRSWD